MTSTVLVPDLCADRLGEALELHFHPRHGAAFWVERARRLGLDVLRDVRTADDLPLLGALERADLSGRALLDYVPRALHDDRATWVLAETGGTTGAPLRTVYTPAEFDAAFTLPFAHAAARRGFATDGAWAFVGPSGPHVIHQAARAFARHHGALEPFSVDFDPRWARSQAPGSLGARLYRDHVVTQAVDVLCREDVRVLFSTPPVLMALAERLDAARREAVRSIHVGGMPFDGAARRRLADAFPHAVLLPAYGNALVGIAPEIDDDDDGAACYAVPRGRLRMRVVEDRHDGAFDADALRRDVAPGMRGRVVVDRVDRTFLLVNLVERDVAEARPVTPSADAAAWSVTRLVAPGPAPSAPVEGGLY